MFLVPYTITISIHKDTLDYLDSLILWFNRFRPRCPPAYQKHLAVAVDPPTTTSTSLPTPPDHPVDTPRPQG